MAQRVALWHYTDGVAWVELFKSVTGRYYCNGKHGERQPLSSNVKTDDQAIKIAQGMINRGVFDPSVKTWIRKTLNNLDQVVHDG